MVLNKILLTSIFLLCIVGLSETKAQTNSIFAPVIQVNNTVITKFEFDQREKFLSALNFPGNHNQLAKTQLIDCLLYTSPSPRDKRQSRMPSSA